MDVSFIVDSSESVGLQNYQKLLEFVRNIAKTLQMSPDESHASLVVFSNNARVQIKLDDHDDIRDFNKAVQDVPYMGKKTRIDKALRVASVGVFNSRAGMRPGLRRVAVLLTEGHQTKTFDSIPLKYAVEPLRRKRVDVFAVGIGSNVRYDELRSVTNSDQNVLLVKSFQGLAGIAEELSKKMCGGMFLRNDSAAKMIIFYDGLGFSCSISHHRGFQLNVLDQGQSSQSLEWEQQNRK